MTTTTVLIILLLLIVFGGFAPWPGPASPGGPPYHGYGYGWPAGLIGMIVLVLLVLMLLR